MDRMSDSGSEDRGSSPLVVTNYFTNGITIK